MKRIKLLTAILLLVSSGTVIAGSFKFDKVRVTEREFKMSSNPTLNVDLKYSNLVITHGVGTEIKVKVEVKTSANSEKDATELMDIATTEYRHSSDMLLILGGIDEYLNKKFNSGRASSYKITYYISLPKNTKMNLASKYGDINIDKTFVDINVEQKYGNIKIDGNVAGVGRYTIGYGNVSINSATATQNIDIKYGNVKIYTAKNVYVMSGYSNVSIESADVVTGSSRYGGVKAGKIKSLVLSQASYGSFSVESFSDKLELLGLRYSNLNVKNTGAGFSSINIPDAGYSDIKISIPQGAFNADLRTKYAKCKVYDQATGEEIKMIIGNNPKATVKVSNSYSNITITK